MPWKIWNDAYGYGKTSKNNFGDLLNLIIFCCKIHPLLNCNLNLNKNHLYFSFHNVMKSGIPMNKINTIWSPFFLRMFLICIVFEAKFDQWLQWYMCILSKLSIYSIKIKMNLSESEMFNIYKLLWKCTQFVWTKIDKD